MVPQLAPMAASYGPGTPEARGHHGKDMAPWALESHCGVGKPSQAMGLGGQEGTVCRQAPEEAGGQ